ncbi:hypothetical protein [Saccharothrix syringae]|uniref:hypothetical protein n=1 Tax=Saccharothrix syringae TaxID=103733 RepID=UPI000AE8FF38
MSRNRFCALSMDLSTANDCPDNQATLAEVQRGFARLGFRNAGTYAYHHLTYSAIQDQLNAGRPIETRIGWKPGAATCTSSTATTAPRAGSAGQPPVHLGDLQPLRRQLQLRVDPHADRGADGSVWTVRDGDRWVVATIATGDVEARRARELPPGGVLLREPQTNTWYAVVGGDVGPRSGVGAQQCGHVRGRPAMPTPARPTRGVEPGAGGVQPASRPS